MGKGGNNTANPTKKRMRRKKTLKTNHPEKKPLSRETKKREKKNEVDGARLYRVSIAGFISNGFPDDLFSRDDEPTS